MEMCNLSAAMMMAKGKSSIIEWILIGLLLTTNNNSYGTKKSV